MRRLIITAIALICVAPAALGQDAVPITSKQDVIYGRVEGSTLLADIAYPQRGDRLPAIVSVIGQSAGGHMVSLVATLGEGSYKRAGGWDTDRDDVRAVISVAGAYDLNTLSWGNLWTPTNEAVDTARRLASPLAHVTASTKPILIIHSDDDRSVPVQQAVDMTQALQKAGVRNRFVHYTDKGHMGIVDDVIKEARAFIAEIEQPK